MKNPAKLTLILALLVVGGGAYALWPSDPPPPELSDGDTGLSIQAQERLAFEIGYLKQEAPPSTEQ